MLPRTQKYRLRAFTLVELLVVIGIIAVLISVLLPALSAARKSARMVQCQSNLRQFYIADAIYVNQYHSWHIPGWTGNGTAGAPPGFLTAGTYSGIDIWTDFQEVRKTLNIAWIDNTGPSTAWRAYIPPDRCCPEAVRGDNDSHAPDASSGFKVLYVDYFYGMNVDGVDYNPSSASDVVYQPQKAQQCDVSGDVAGSPPTVKSVHGFRSSQVHRPAEKIFLCDAMYWWVNEWGSGVSPGWKGKISNYDITKETTHQNFPGGDTERTVAWRHKGNMANVCFFDGHVEGVSKDRFTVRDPATGVLSPNLVMWRPLE